MTPDQITLLVFCLSVCAIILIAAKYKIAKWRENRKRKQAIKAIRKQWLEEQKASRMPEEKITFAEYRRERAGIDGPLSTLDALFLAYSEVSRESKDFFKTDLAKGGFIIAFVLNIPLSGFLAVRYYLHHGGLMNAFSGFIVLLVIIPLFLVTYPSLLLVLVVIPVFIFKSGVKYCQLRGDYQIRYGRDFRGGVWYMLAPVYGAFKFILSVAALLLILMTVVHLINLHPMLRGLYWRSYDD